MRYLSTILNCGKKFYNFHSTQRKLLQTLEISNSSPSEIESLQTLNTTHFQAGEERAGCFTFVVLCMLCSCCRSLTLLNDAMG